MAEDKDKKGNELLGQDFLGDMQKNVDSMPTTGLFDKLAKLGAQQRLQPLADQKRFESGYKPLLKMVEDAEKRVTDGMQAYKDAYPDFDDSKLHGGVGDLITGTMTENNARFKELNRQLAYMSPRNPKYADTVSEIEKIEKSIVSLRDNNLKLMEIKNSINTGNLKLKDISKGNEPGLKNMYSDIQQGISDNFQNIDGKLYWVDPNPDLSDDDPYKKVSVESIKAGAPAMTNGAARDEHNDIMNNIVDIPIESPNYQENLNYAVGIMFEKIEDDGVKSLIFDSENSKNEPHSKGLNMFNTADWFEEFYREANVASGDVIDVRRDIQRNGVDYDVNGVNVLNHFKNWYITKLDSLPKSDKGKPAEAKTDLNKPFPDSRDENSEENPPKTFDNLNKKDILEFNDAWATKNETKFIEKLEDSFPGLNTKKMLNEANIFRNDEVKFDLDNEYFKNFDFGRGKNGTRQTYLVGSDVDKDKFLNVVNIYSIASSVDAPEWYDAEKYGEWIELSPEKRMDLVQDTIAPETKYNAATAGMFT